MDFRHLRSISRSRPIANNASEPLDFQDLPASILEAIFPGYGIISRFLYQNAGVDVSSLVSVAITVIALATASRYSWKWINLFLSNFFMASVFVDENDDLHETCMEWLAAQRMSQRARSVKAVTQVSNAWEETNSDEDFVQMAMGPNGLFNFGKWAANVPPRYEPYYGLHHFRFRGRFFFINRSQRQNTTISGSNIRANQEELLEIKCLGRSSRPARALLEHIKTWSLERESSMTVIRRPAIREMRRPGWAKAWSRPSRPMSTVVLDSSQKEAVIADINEYLHPSAARWYASRGIPYRRGYLFHGPPGTGKTSLSFALAGVFGLEIHVISLLEPALTESDLNVLFNTLPRRCIVLLEDIDTAGLNRNKTEEATKTIDEKPDPSTHEQKPSSPQNPESPKNPLPNGITSASSATAPDDSPQAPTIAAMADLTRALRDNSSQHQQQRRPHGAAAAPPTAAPPEPNRPGISLSGLLNTIDGVASHEGRVLIMTSNQPEKLDAALVRPGRVDMRVAFGPAGREQAAELFVRMFDGADESAASGKKGLGSKSARKVDEVARIEGKEEEGGGEDGTIAKGDGMVGAENVKELARKFAEALPEGEFTPAEIQGFLLTRRKDPVRAVEEVASWRDDVLASRKDHPR
ncbi:MAG: hypothetical protein M1822_004729 [Bathelium mastoideum]|nr:MAG: hypothetical protein M1822_004729 [Bathelium mastoideum]